MSPPPAFSRQVRLRLRLRVRARVHVRTLAVAAAVAIAASACAAHDPGLRLDTPAPAPAPPGLDHEALTFRGAGIELYAQHWWPVHAEPRAVVVIHHGLADHSARYADLAARLVRAGYAVWALDMRGHGRSPGSRIGVDRADLFLDDLDALFRLVREREPGRPLFLYGHSVGGMVSCLYTIERQPELAGLVLVAPAIAFDAPPLQAAAISVFAALAPELPAVPPEHAAFSRRPEVVAEMDRDPLIHQGKGPARTARSITDGVARIWAAPERLQVPLLVEHGTADTLTAPSGSRDLVARAGSADRTLRLHQGLFHDMLREPDGAGDRVADEIVAWLDAHSGGAAVTFTSSRPTGRLRGDRHGQALGVELDLRGELPSEAALGDTGVTAGLRLRAGIGRGGPGVGYHGGLDLRAGRLDGGHYEADAHVLGLALRGPGGAVVALSGGVGVGGVRGAGATHAPIELSAELPLGPTRLLLRGGLGWRLGGADYGGDAHGLADEAAALAGLRLGRDRHYWGDVVAGAGPYLALTYRNLGGVELMGVALGVELWGGN
jgi:alpha-beta hydrolase superfamily lysophospholipase